MRIVVLLPAPLTPRNPKTSPTSTSRSRSRTAVRRPYRLVSPGIVGMKDLKRVGRVAIKALIYFEVVTTLALVVGLLLVNVWGPGAGMNVDPGTIDTTSIQSYTSQAGQQSVSEFVMHIIPATIV